MKILLYKILVLHMLGMVSSSPENYKKKDDVLKLHTSQMYHSLDVSEPDSEISEICISDQKSIDGDIYRDITVKPGIIVNEIYNGDDEIWKAKPNRDLVKLVLIKKRGNYIYVIITKDRSNRLAETKIVITKVSITFSSYKDIEYPLLNYSTNENDSRSNNLRIEEPQTKQIESTSSRTKQGLKAPFQSREYMNDLLPSFLTKPKFREMDEDEKRK